MEKPPLYYWLASALSWLCKDYLTLPDGARLASGVFSLLTLIFTGMTGRLAWGMGYGRLAVVTMIACFGLLYESHYMITDVPMLTGYAIATYGALLGRKSPISGGIWLGTGAGIGFLAKGLLVPGTLGVTLLLLPLLFQPWRNQNFAKTLGIALIAALPWLLIWPIALWLRSHELFYEWFWLNNVGRFLGFSVPQLGAQSSTEFWPRTLPWFAWPAWPLAIIVVWQRREQLMQSAPVQLGMVSFIVYFIVMQVSASARTAYGLPMLTGLVLLATPATLSTPRFQRALDWFSRFFFVPIIALAWYVWIILYRTAHAPAWQWLVKGLAPEFVTPLQPLALTAALTASATLPLMWFSWHKYPARGVISSALHLTVLWLILNTLWLPWIDNAKRYRDVFNQAIAQLPTNVHCVSGLQLGESTRPMFVYYFQLKNQPYTIGDSPACKAVLIDQWDMSTPKTPPNWRLVWKGTRPQENEDQFWLYLRSQ